jgi:hypothetical protein
MKKIALMAGLIAMSVGMAAPAALAGDDDYAIVNKTGMDITHLYMSPNNDNQWGGDILGRDVLETDDECGIEFDPNDEECAYDIKIVDGDGKGWIVANIDLCKYHKVTFMKQGAKVVFSAN